MVSPHPRGFHHSSTNATVGRPTHGVVPRSLTLGRSFNRPLTDVRWPPLEVLNFGEQRLGPGELWDPWVPLGSRGVLLPTHGSEAE